MAPATTTKKPAARRTAAPKAAAAPAEPEHTDPPPAEDTEPKPPPELDPDSGNGDVIVVPIGKEAEEPEEEPGPVVDVFTYGKTTYTMPVEVTAQQALHATWVMKTHGTLTGGMQIVERLLGPAALQVLLTAPEIKDEHILGVITKVTKHVWGRAEEAQGE